MAAALSPREKWIASNPLRKARLKKKMSQQECATHLNVTVQTVRQWETGGWSPSADGYVKVANYTGQFVSDVITAWVKWKRKPL